MNVGNNGTCALNMLSGNAPLVRTNQHHYMLATCIAVFRPENRYQVEPANAHVKGEQKFYNTNHFMAVSMMGLPLNTTTISGVQFLLFIATQVAHLCYIPSLLNGKTITSIFWQIHMQPKPYKTCTSFEEIQIPQSKQFSTMQQAIILHVLNWFCREWNRVIQLTRRN